MKKSIALAFTLYCIFNFSTSAQDFQTFTYFQKDTLNLELDLFLPDTIIYEETPMVIYVHGGGFSKGDRGGGHKLALFLKERGIATASITYTLYMKGKSFGCDGLLPEKIKAIQIAANQLWLATGFLIKNKEKFNLDTTRLFIAGSSAGAETVLHAAFWDRKTMDLYGHQLPHSFKYAGVIAGAGAIMDLNLITEENLIPVMMFHGDQDKLVPYGTAAHHYCAPNSPGWLMLFGSYSIYEHISDLGRTVYLISFRGEGHNKAGAHFYQDQQPVYEFLMDISEKKHFQKHLEVKNQ